MIRKYGLTKSRKRFKIGFTFMKKESSKDKTTMTAREVAVLVEDLLSQFRVFGEGLASIREGLSTLKDKVESVREGLSTLKDKVESVRENLAALKDKVESIFEEQGRQKEDISIIKADIGVIKRDVAEIKEILKNHEERLTHLEVAK